MSNERDISLGFPVPDWTSRPWPPASPMAGRTCTVRPLNVSTDAGPLWEANALDTAHHIWDYLPYGPFAAPDDYRAWLTSMVEARDPFIHAIIDHDTGQAVGVATYLRINPDEGSIEVGHINYSPKLQRTVASTEAMYLMMRRAFDELGYRRYEWKCNSLNERSMRAALRLGFTPEGIHRQAAVVKGRNRDTAWFSILDSEWPSVKAAFETWLAPPNFTAGGEQRVRLEDVRAAINSS